MILLNPGPVTLSPRMRAALLNPDLCHREPEFADLQDDIRARLLGVYGLLPADYVAPYKVPRYRRRVGRIQRNAYRPYLLGKLWRQLLDAQGLSHSRTGDEAGRDIREWCSILDLTWPVVLREEADALVIAYGLDVDVGGPRQLADPETCPVRCAGHCFDTGSLPNPYPGLNPPFSKR